MEGDETVSLDFIWDQWIDLLEPLLEHEQQTLHLLENISLNDSELAGLAWQCLEYHSFRSSVLSMLSKLDLLEQQLVTQATSWRRSRITSIKVLTSFHFDKIELQSNLGSITSRCWGKEPALFPRRNVDRTRESGGKSSLSWTNPCWSECRCPHAGNSFSELQ